MIKKNGVKSWAAYNQKLKKRGSLTFFVEEDFLKKWHYKDKKVKGGNCVFNYGNFSNQGYDKQKAL